MKHSLTRPIIALSALLLSTSLGACALTLSQRPAVLVDTSATTLLFPTALVHPAPTLAPLPAAIPQLPADLLRAQPTVVPAPTALPRPVRTTQLQFGAQAHLFYTDRPTPLNLAREGGFGWVRQQIHWRDQEGPAGRYAWGELDNIVGDVHASGLKLLISITRAPEFYTANGQNGLPATAEPLGNFVDALVRRYPGQIGAIQIWNEQNLAYENGGQVAQTDAGHYVELLKVAYTRIKALDPRIIVVSGSPASTATNNPAIAIDDASYFEGMFAYQGGVIRDFVDVIGVHPGGSANAPETLWPEAPSQAQGWTDHRTFYFRRIEDYRALMVKYQLDQKPVWITEFGWATANTTPGYEFGNQISLDAQAEYLVDAMRLAEEKYPWVDNMFVWNLTFGPLWAQQGQPLHEQASFSILHGDYTPRPAYLLMRAYIEELRAAGR
jgi:polysaccharide biosynthesis protein PslG